MCYTRRKIEGGVCALRESDDANIFKPNGGQSRNLNIYDQNAKLSYEVFSIDHMYHTTVNDYMMMRVYSIHCSKKTREGYI